MGGVWKEGLHRDLMKLSFSGLGSGPWQVGLNLESPTERDCSAIATLLLSKTRLLVSVVWGVQFQVALGLPKLPCHTDIFFSLKGTKEGYSKIYKPRRKL